MERTGICWKSVFSHLENAGITAWVVNAHFIKHVPGRRNYMLDSEWLAVLARFGLVRASFIPPKDLRELRLVSRYRRMLSAAMCSSQINRLHKMSRARPGNNVIGYILCDCANAARMTVSTPEAKYRSLMVRKSYKNAIVAVAHKMSRLRSTCCCRAASPTLTKPSTTRPSAPRRTRRAGSNQECEPTNCAIRLLGPRHLHTWPGLAHM